MVLNHVLRDLASMAFTTFIRAHAPVSPALQPHKPRLPALSPTAWPLRMLSSPLRSSTQFILLTLPWLAWRDSLPKATPRKHTVQSKSKSGLVMQHNPKTTLPDLPLCQFAILKPLLFRNSRIFPAFQGSTQMSPLQESVPRTLSLPSRAAPIILSLNTHLALVLLCYNTNNTCIKSHNYPIICFVSYPPNRV